MKHQNCDGPVRRMLCVLPAITVFLGAVVLVGCGAPTEDTLFTPMTPITINSAADIAQESDADYDNNDNGLISGATMMSWLDDIAADNTWDNRPPGITGKLVILQTGTPPNPPPFGTDPDGKGIGGREFLTHDDVNVFTYAVPNGAWVQTRSNGVVYTPSMVADGKQMDALLKLYNIDPFNDMIVFAMGVGSNFNNMMIGRGWYMFRYWGIDKKNLAILNGGIDSASIILAGYFDVDPSTPPGTGKITIDQVRVDNTALQASLQEMMAVAEAEGVDDTQTTVPAGGAFILDARGNTTNEYSGGANATGSPNPGRFVAFEGHIAGALPLPNGFDFTSLLDPANGYRYINKNTGSPNIANLIGPAGYASGNTVYTYCRTTYRAMVTGIATGVILGYPTKFYDGGWIEWGQLAWTYNSDYGVNLAADSLWRTDLATVSTPINYNVLSGVDPLAPDWLVDEYAVSANLLIDTDKAYKWGEESTDDSGPPGGGGGGCGG